MAKDAGIDLNPDKYTQNVQLDYGPIAKNFPELMRNQPVSEATNASDSAMSLASKLIARSKSAPNPSIECTDEQHVPASQPLDLNLPRGKRFSRAATSASNLAAYEEESDDSNFTILDSPQPHRSSNKPVFGTGTSGPRKGMSRPASPASDIEMEVLGTFPRTARTTSASSTVISQTNRSELRTAGASYYRPHVPLQHMRAYKAWHDQQSLEDICVLLRSKANPLKKTTVMYVLAFLSPILK